MIRNVTLTTCIITNRGGFSIQQIKKVFNMLKKGHVAIIVHQINVKEALINPV